MKLKNKSFQELTKEIDPLKANMVDLDPREDLTLDSLTPIRGPEKGVDQDRRVLNHTDWLQFDSKRRVKHHSNTEE